MDLLMTETYGRIIVQLSLARVELNNTKTNIFLCFIQNITNL